MLPALGASETRTTPPSAITIPRFCSAAGRSPVTAPKSTAATDALAAIGATTLIIPMASPR